MTSRDGAINHGFLYCSRRLQQPHNIGNRRATLADPVGNFGMGEAKFLNQRLISRAFFNRVEIGPLYIFDQRPLH